MDQIGNPAASSTSRLARGRETKFTPERRQQIVNLVERGKSREEIAELVGVTVGTLQVTCSKFGISLRRPRFDTGTGYLRLRSRNETPAAEGTDDPTSHGELLSQPPLQPLPAEQAQIATPRRARARMYAQDTVSFSLKIQYRGGERTSEIPLTQDMIKQLAIESWMRDMKIGEVISKVIVGAIKSDLLLSVLD